MLPDHAATYTNGWPSTWAFGILWMPGELPPELVNGLPGELYRPAEKY